MDLRDVAGKLFGGSGFEQLDDPAVLQNNQSSGHRHRVGDIMGDDQSRHIGAIQLRLQQVAHSYLSVNVKCGSGLVEYQNGRFYGECPSQTY